ncbi:MULTISPECIES: alpha/beta fold hydrolase [Legionella]|uniref:Lipolytic protein n=1 Tax=Legionella drozanskii LLAP-1 TaxID=1212489 RepID=A0A0W0SM17_9GAMM|nr:MULTISPECIES: alpha/beta hydrolase [Legionella]KTC83989.1 lipolytic protein [Legionella drozanskii LLAP-1]PJE15843.1 MAG: alpha/beta hydrolase [Legionella sp.]
MLQETLVLLPGVLSDEKVWSHQIKHLSHLVPCQVIPLTVKDCMEDLLAMVLETVKGRFILAGHSMGGWLALELAKAAPERISKLCLLNTSAQADPPEKRKDRFAMIEAVARGKFHSLAEDIAERYVYCSNLKKEVLAMFLSVGEKSFLNQEKALLTRRETVSILPQLTMPTMIIHAEYDRVFSLESHLELAQKIPHAKLAIIEDSGHMSPMEAPQAVTTLMRFWIDYF